LARKRAVELDALAGEPLVLLDRSTAGRALLDREFEARGLAPKIVMEMSSVEVLKRLVELGFGLSVVPAFSAVRESAAGSLASVPLRGFAPRSIGLLTPTLGPLSHAGRAFVEVLRAELSRGGRGGLAR
jgi:LysR family cys regulon transcriptional activator